MLQRYCREYRLSKGVLLKELTGGKQVKTLSAFERGMSNNIAHFEKYIRLSILKGDYDLFMNGVLKEIANDNNTPT